MLLTGAVLMLAGSWSLLFKKSEAKGAKRCARCGTIYEPGPNGALMPMN